MVTREIVQRNDYVNHTRPVSSVISNHCIMKIFAVSINTTFYLKTMHFNAVAIKINDLNSHPNSNEWNEQMEWARWQLSQLKIWSRHFYDLNLPFLVRKLCAYSDATDINCAFYPIENLTNKMNKTNNRNHYSNFVNFVMMETAYCLWILQWLYGTWPSWSSLFYCIVGSEPPLTVDIFINFQFIKFMACYYAADMKIA